MTMLEWLETPWIISLGFVLASLRLYFEVMAFYVTEKNSVGDFWQKVIFSSKNLWGVERAQRIHHYGLIMSIGYVVLFAPGMLLS